MPIFKFEAFYRFTMIGSSSGSYSASPPSTALLLWPAHGGWNACCLSHWARSFHSKWVFFSDLTDSSLYFQIGSVAPSYVSPCRTVASYSRVSRFASAMSRFLSLKPTFALKCAGDLYLLWPYCMWRVFKMLCKSSVSPLTWKQTHYLLTSNLVFCIADILHESHRLHIIITIERDLT